MENLGIDIKLLIAQLINFTLFFIIVKKYIAKPFGQFLNQEKNKEKEKVELMENMRKQEESLVKKEKEMQEKMRKQMNIILADAKKEAEQIKSEVIKEAKEEAESIKVNAKKEIEQEKNNLYQQTKQKMADLCFLIINKTLSDLLDEDTKRKISQQMLKNLGKNVNFYEN